jgi:hypothetical protein
MQYSYRLRPLPGAGSLTAVQFALAVVALVNHVISAAVPSLTDAGAAGAVVSTV